MTASEFLNAVANGDRDIVQLLLDALAETGTAYCVIGGLAVNAYAEPVVSLDLDVVVVAANLDAICAALDKRGFRIERFPHSVNASTPRSDLRIQLQTDERYQAFLPCAHKQTVLGYEMHVAALVDVLQGKLWAYRDKTRRPSKRQKDLADIIRMVETHPDKKASLPDDLLGLLE